MGRNNKGFSLVELLVSISIAAIVAGSIGYFLTISLRMYGNETSDVALQQELQTTLNQIVDYAMESQFVSSQFTDGNKKYLALGSFSDSNELDAEIIWQDGDKLYFKSANVSGNDMISQISDLVPDSGNSSNTNLLAEYVSDFSVSVNGISVVTDDAGNTTNVFTNPISLSISLGFSKKASTKDINKRVSDTIMLRNRIDGPVYADGEVYERKDTNSASFKIETTTVENEKKLGSIAATKTVIGGHEGDFTILEIIPNPQFALMGYLVGGLEPIGSDGLDALVNCITGIKDTVQYADGSIGFNACSQLLSGGDIPNVVTATNLRMNGYFEKVSPSYRDGGGGVYALISNEIMGYYESVGAGNGNYKAVDGKDPSWYCESKYKMTIDGYNQNNEKYFEKSSGGGYRFVFAQLENDSGLHFVSEYASDTSKDKSDRNFCWVWREDNSVSGNYYKASDSSSSINIEDVDFSNIPVGAKFYVSNYKKNKIVNNEMFLLYCLNKNLSTESHGYVYNDGTNVQYDSNNRSVVDNYKANHNIKIVSCTPEELSASESIYDQYIDSADFIMICSNPGTVYGQAENLFSVEYSSKITNKSDYYFSGDITFEQMRRIYNRVINNDVSIACSHTMNRRKNGGSVDVVNTTNLAKLFFMLYRFENSNIVFDQDTKSFYSTFNNEYHGVDITQDQTIIKAGRKGSNETVSYRYSGRILFTDFMQSYVDAGKAYSSPKFDSLFVDGSNNYKTTDFIHIAENSSLFTENKLITNPVDNMGASVGDVVVGPTKSFKGKTWESYTNTKIYTDWANDNAIFSSYNLGNENKTALAPFLMNEYYGEQGFKLNGNDGTGGIYANQMLFNDGGTIMMYKKDSSQQGLNWFQDIIKTSGHSTETDLLGDITIVGAGERYGPTLDESSNKTYPEWNVRYRDEAVTTPTGEKVIYLTASEYEKAGGVIGRKWQDGDPWGEGLDVYSVVASSRPFKEKTDPDNGRAKYHRLEGLTNPSDGSVIVPVTANWNSSTPQVPNPAPYQYKAESSERQYVYEFHYHIDPIYFHNFGNPNNDGNHKFTAKIAAIDNDGKEYHGEEEIYIVIRDEFDLD